MRIADVVGTVTLNSVHPSMVGASFKLVTPLGWDQLADRSSEPLEEIVVYDELGAGVGNRIAISEGREGATSQGRRQTQKFGRVVGRRLGSQMIQEVRGGADLMEGLRCTAPEQLSDPCEDPEGRVEDPILPLVAEPCAQPAERFADLSEDSGEIPGLAIQG